MGCQSCRLKALECLERELQRARDSYEVGGTLAPLMVISAGGTAFAAIGLLSEEEVASWNLKGAAAMEEVKSRTRRRAH